MASGRRRLAKKKSGPERRATGRRVVSRKITRAEREVRHELVAGFQALRGMHIDDVYPPSDRAGEGMLLPCRAAPRRRRRIARGVDVRPHPSSRSTQMAAKLNRRGSTRLPRIAEAAADPAVRDELLNALMSIRGMNIDDVYPPSGAHDEVRG